MSVVILLTSDAEGGKLVNDFRDPVHHGGNPYSTLRRLAGHVRARAEFQLIPNGFFSRNPALDVLRPEQRCYQLPRQRKAAVNPGRLEVLGKCHGEGSKDSVKF